MKEVVLHHDNAQPHMAAVITEMIRKLESYLPPHAAHSPDILNHIVSYCTKMCYKDADL